MSDLPNNHMETTRDEQGVTTGSRFAPCAGYLPNESHPRQSSGVAGRDGSVKPHDCGAAHRLKCLDLFCGAGGASMGIYLAGFEVTGVDILPQPKYPFRFIQGDAMKADLDGYDLVWASPPCQAYTEMQRMHKHRIAHADLVAPIREKLKAWGGLWIIENVKGSPLNPGVMLCGSMFGLPIIKHRYFEASFELPLLMPSCDHSRVYDPWHGGSGVRTIHKMRAAQDTPWIPSGGGASRKRGRSGDVNNAIPPAYSEFLARQAFELLRSELVRRVTGLSVPDERTNTNSAQAEASQRQNASNSATDGRP